MNERKYAAESVTDLAEIQRIVKIPDEFSDREPHILGHLALSGALFEGHFELTSGLHSRYFLRTAKLEGRSDWYEHLGRMVAERLEKDKIGFDKSLSLDDSGICLAHDILDYSMKPSWMATVAFPDEKGGVLTDISQYIIGLFDNDKVILIDDMVQSPWTLNKLHDIALANKAKPVAAITHACMDREELKRFGEEKGYPVYALVDLQKKCSMWTPRDCPLCTDGPELLPTWQM